VGGDGCQGVGGDVLGGGTGVVCERGAGDAGEVSSGGGEWAGASGVEEPWVVDAAGVGGVGYAEGSGAGEREDVSVG